MKWMEIKSFVFHFHYSSIKCYHFCRKNGPQYTVGLQLQLLGVHATINQINHILIYVHGFYYVYIKQELHMFPSDYFWKTWPSRHEFFGLLSPSSKIAFCFSEWYTTTQCTCDLILEWRKLGNYIPFKLMYIWCNVLFFGTIKIHREMTTFWRNILPPPSAVK
jgi:hypothetical protein